MLIIFGKKWKKGAKKQCKCIEGAEVNEKSNERVYSTFNQAEEKFSNDLNLTFYVAFHPFHFASYTSRCKKRGNG